MCVLRVKRGWEHERGGRRGRQEGLGVVEELVIRGRNEQLQRLRLERVGREERNGVDWLREGEGG